MDDLDKWFAEQVSSPFGSLLLFLLIFLTRLAVDHRLRRRSERRKKGAHKTVPHG